MSDLSILSERPHIAPMPRARVFNAYLQEMRAECLRYLRNPGFMLPTLLGQFKQSTGSFRIGFVVLGSVALLCLVLLRRLETRA